MAGVYGKCGDCAYGGLHGHELTTEIILENDRPMKLDVRLIDAPDRRRRKTPTSSH
jgi:hypothetical protein